MPRSEKMLERLAKAADLLDEPIPGSPLVEIMGGHRVLIENHRGICQYGDGLVRIHVKFGVISVHGQNLVLTRMTKEQLVVSGTIHSVSLDRGSAV